MPGTDALPADYLDRVYAGCLGKVLGVYLGRPFEGWSHERIAAQFGDIDFYVHDKVGVPLVVADDDISGTFTFLRALPDHGSTLDLTPAQIGNTWLNYLVERKTVLWWGGMGVSTEHTAYLRLAAGIKAPASGSMELNGQVVAEQIGAQIFIDGWAMVAPGRPGLAADLARRAGSVSHDGESVYAAQLLAAMEAQAFVTDDIDELIDTGLRFVPADSLIATMIAGIRRWRIEEPDWRAARDLLDRDYGYHRYGGGCHVIPNHGLIILALLYGDGDWDRSMMIVNTCGWDTDCNSGNLGCLLGIRNGVAALTAEQDWRSPVADRIIMPTADGGGTVTDVAREALAVANVGRALAGLGSLQPKDGARFHFSLPGSVQGFTICSGDGSLGARGADDPDERRLSVVLSGVTEVTTPTFLAPEDFQMPGYQLLASPTLYPGQTVTATVVADASNTADVTARLVIHHYGAHDEDRQVLGDLVTVIAGSSARLELLVPDVGGQPIHQVGVVFDGEPGDRIDLDRLGWTGEPDVTLRQPTETSTMWSRAWVEGVDHFMDHVGSHPDRHLWMAQDRGRGLVQHGTREWRDYEVTATITPHLADVTGISVRTQGMRRYYAVLVSRDGVVQLVKVVDDSEAVLAEAKVAWHLDSEYRITISVSGRPGSVRLAASVNGTDLDATDHSDDADGRLDGGALGIVVDTGAIKVGNVGVRPVV
ncbi:MAG TPA: ADP-ribosylglycohydrolase family protein [Actinopolymorphaceae bacterium]|jgi:ADP-ribosylglycohydrolase